MRPIHLRKRVPIYFLRLLPPNPMARFCISYMPDISSFISSMIILASRRDLAIRFFISTLSMCPVKFCPWIHTVRPTHCAKWEKDKEEEEVVVVTL